MKHSRSMLVASTLALFSVPGTAQNGEPDYERTYEESFDIGKSQGIRIDHSFGPVTVDVWSPGSSENGVQVKARIEAKGKDSRRFGEAVEINVRPDSGTFLVETRYPRNADGSNRWENISFGVSLSLTIPIEHALEVGNSFGDVLLSGVVGDLDVHCSNGDLRLRDVRGEINSRSSFGNVDMEGCAGKATIDNSNGRLRIRRHRGGGLILDNSFGAITLEDSEGDLELDCSNGKIDVQKVRGSVRSKGSFGDQRYRDIGGSLIVDGSNADLEAQRIAGDVRLDTSFGSIDLEDIQGKAELRCGNGTVKVRRVKGRLELEGSFGTVELEDVGGCEVNYQNGTVKLREIHGEARVENTFGPVNLREVDGDVYVRAQNSNVRVLGTPWKKERSFDCRTSFGYIEIELPRPASAALDLATSFGRIESDFELSGVDRGQTRERCKCTLGEGEMKVKLHASNGSVKLRKGPKRKGSANGPLAR